MSQKSWKRQVNIPIIFIIILCLLTGFLYVIRIMVANTPMDYDKIKIYGTKAKVDSMEKVGQIEEAEK